MSQIEIEIEYKLVKSDKSNINLYYDYSEFYIFVMDQEIYKLYGRPKIFEYILCLHFLSK